MRKFQKQFSENLLDHESFMTPSPVVSGQSLTGAEIFRRKSAGLPVGCAMRDFNQVNPFLEKFSIYDSIGNFRVRHGMIGSDEIDSSEPPAPEPASSPAAADPPAATADQ